MAPQSISQLISAAPRGENNHTQVSAARTRGCSGVTTLPAASTRGTRLAGVNQRAVTSARVVGVVVGAGVTRSGNARSWNTVPPGAPGEEARDSRTRTTNGAPARVAGLERRHVADPADQMS